MAAYSLAMGAIAAVLNRSGQRPGEDLVLKFLEHFAANERAGAFYEREGFVVDRIEPHPSGDPARATVWRVRNIG